MTKRDVGGMGESVLRKWAHERGAVINKAEYDRGGWDFLIEWEPVRRENRVPLDRQEGSLQCLVQVKATDSNARRRSVSLRNWHRFSTTALPAFYLVLEFSGKADCQAAFLRHHWERDIEETLKRLRTLDAAGIEDFSRKTRNLTWGSSDAIAPTSEALFGALERVIATSLADYSQKKAKLVSVRPKTQSRASCCRVRGPSFGRRSPHCPSRVRMSA